MTNNKLLEQEEIDLLMRNAQLEQQPPPDAESVQTQEEVLKPEEKDALGEVGNISMGSASTTLSELLSQKVSITHPRVWVTTKGELFKTFTVPYLVIKVNFIEGLQGFNVLVMRVQDALIVADLMMGGEGTPQQQQLSEMEISAASEAMNMMIGTASTALSQMFNKSINISPPTTVVLEDIGEEISKDAMPELNDEDILVVVSFSMSIGDKVVDTELMQIMGVETAREKAMLLWQDLNNMFQEEQSEPAPVEQTGGEDEGDLSQEMIDAMFNQSQESPGAVPEPPPAPTPPPAFGNASPAPAAVAAPRNLDLILDIPLQVSVILGRTKRPIKEVLSIGPGSVVELEALADEPVEILVNGTLVAEGEVVVVNENFGVKITNIISPEERVKRLVK